MTHTVPARPGLSSGVLKLFAIAAMLCDHIAWYWVPTATPLGFAMHFVGRFTAPIMCFCAAEGFHHTRSLPRYLLRMLAFAAASHLPYSWYQYGVLWPFKGTGMGASLFLGLCALAVCSAPNIPVGWKFVFTILAVVLSHWSDWSYLAVLWIVLFGLLRERPLLAALCCAAAAALVIPDYIHSPAYLFQLGVFPALLMPCLLYNGKPGPKLKWLFYLFYPIHLALLAYLFRGLGLR